MLIKMTKSGSTFLRATFNKVGIHSLTIGVVNIGNLQFINCIKKSREHYRHYGSFINLNINIIQ